MATDVNHTITKNQPVFQMLNDDTYSLNENTEFYESRNSFESAREHLTDIFEPRMNSKITINEKISSDIQEQFQSVQNDDTKEFDEAKEDIETPLTLEETINELEAQKSQAEKDQPSPDQGERGSLKDNSSYISGKTQSKQSSLFHEDQPSPSISTQSNKSKKSSLDLLDMASSSSLNRKTSLAGSLNDSRSTPVLSSDDESEKDHIVANEENIGVDEGHQESEVKDFIHNEEETIVSFDSIFSHQLSNKGSSIQITESQQIHEEVIMEPTKPKSNRVRYKRVRTFYNKCIEKYYSAKTWVTVAFKRRPKYNQQLEPKSKSAENVTTVRLESFDNQRVSHSVENFSQYTASISVIEEETSSPFPGFFTPIYYNQRKTGSIMSGNRLLDPSNDASSAVFNIRELCEEKFYYNPQ